MSETPRLPLGLYVHWPFCKSKCPYCDFNSHVADSIDHARWMDALIRELEGQNEALGERQLDTIFFGGGTPSLMEPKTVAALVERAQTLFRPSNQLEITLEANPTSIEAEKFEAFRAAGINRVSIGVQSLNDGDLRFLGREHSVSQAFDAIEIARNCFDRVSIDLIYARPEQTLNSWLEELERALSLGLDHMSLYQLTIEETTPFYARHRRGEFRIPEEELAADLYLATNQRMAEAGLEAYEVSNYAKPGQESRHNLIYWTGGDYLGIGPGAHGRVTETSGSRFATRTHRAPQIWLERVEGQGQALVDRDQLTEDDRLVEAVMMELRLSQGLEAASWKARFGTTPFQTFDADTLQALEAADLIAVTSDGGLRATDQGRLALNALIAKLVG